MNLRRGIFWYASRSRAICASRRTASSVFCMISFAVGDSVGSASSSGFGSGAAIAVGERSCVIISRVVFSFTSCRAEATATALRGVSRGSTGSGVFARRF